ncbi:hypothetical protein N2152v2_002694 [Parachlorella kessleri]
MALRGQGSLQQLLGKGFKKSGIRRQGSLKETQVGADCPLISNQQAPLPSALESRTAATCNGDIEEPEEEGVRCPICKQKLSSDIAEINGHFTSRRLQQQRGAVSTSGAVQSLSGTDNIALLDGRPSKYQTPVGGQVGSEAALEPSDTSQPGGGSQAAHQHAPDKCSLGSHSSPGGCELDSQPGLRQQQRQAGLGQPRHGGGQPPQQVSHEALLTQPPQQRDGSQQGRSDLLSQGGRAAAAVLSIPQCLVVGRHFQGGGAGGANCCAGQRLAVRWEEGNPRDPYALLVTLALSGEPLGHLPSVVARHLAPLLRFHGVVVEGVVLQDPSGDKAPVPVELQVTLRGPPLSPSPKARPKLEATVQRAQQAAAEHAQRQGAGGLTTGSRLRANFLTVMDTVLEHDAHLLDGAELGFADAFRDLDPAAACLLLRLFQRRGPWFRVGTLSYAEVPDVPAALLALCTAGLAHIVQADGSLHSCAHSAAELAQPSIAAATPTRAAVAGLQQSAVEVAPSFIGVADEAHSKASEEPLAGCAAAAAPSSCGDSDDSWEVEEVAEQGEQQSEALSGCGGASRAGEPGEAAATGDRTLRHATSSLEDWQQCTRHEGQQQQQRREREAPDPPAQRELVTISWQGLADLLTVPELGAVLVVLAGLAGGRGAAGGAVASRAAGGGNRSQVLEALKALAGRDEAATRQALLQATGDVVKLSAWCCNAINRFQRLFFLNEGHSLSHFLAVDLGGVRYPRYQVWRSRSAFASREALLRYESALRHAEALTDAVEVGDEDMAEQVLQHAWAALDTGEHKQLGDGGAELPLFLKRFNAGWVYCMMATLGVSLLERGRKYQEAIERLQQLLGGECCPSRRGEWWLRLSLDSEHLGRGQASLEIAEAALADEWLSHGDRLALQRRVLRLGKPPHRWRKPGWAGEASREPRERRIEAAPLSSAVGLKSRFQGLDGEQCTVEELALQYYASEAGGGWQGVHSEGGVWATLFGLLLWDVLFCTDVPDVLRTPFQTAPLDLDTDAFFPARQAAIEATLARIAAGQGPAMLAASWQAQAGTFCRGVNWERHSLDELQLLAECVGGPGLAEVCRLLAEDHAGWSGGMPDLLLWHPGRCAALLSEVKGPRDRLSDQQRAWMNALAAAGLDCEVLKVVEPRPQQQQQHLPARKRKGR